MAEQKCVLSVWCPARSLVDVGKHVGHLVQHGLQV